MHWIKAASQDMSSLKMCWWCNHRDSTISPKQKAWMKRWKVCGFYLSFGQVTTKHTTPPEQDWNLASRRQRGDISRDWRGQSRYVAGNSKCPPSWVRPPCQMSLTHFMLTVFWSPQYKTQADDAVPTALHSVFTHLENNNSCIRIQFVDFSSAFKTKNIKMGGNVVIFPIRTGWLQTCIFMC